MVTGKGEIFEELVREYFSRRGFLAVRSVMFQFENDDVTDIDIWLYGKQASGFRMHGIVDAKNKKSPKAFERILWVKGLQAITGSDRAFVATTDSSEKTAAFGEQNNVLVLTKSFLQSIVDPDNGGRLSLEEFNEYIHLFPSWKADGDWIRVINRVKSAVASTPPYQAFNIASAAFSFFAERIQTRPIYADQALRCALLVAAYACVALDRALEPLQFSAPALRKSSIVNGVAFGDSGDGKVRKSIKSVIDVIQEHVENGKAVSAKVRSFFDRLPTAVRADILSEHFESEARSQKLFQISRELERSAFLKQGINLDLSVDAKSTLGAITDYCAIDRKLLLPAFKSPSQNQHTANAVGDAGDSANAEQRIELEKRLL